MATTTFSTRVKSELLHRIEELAAGAGLTRNEWVVAALEEALSDPDDPAEWRASIEGVDRSVPAPDDCIHARAKVLNLKTCSVCGVRL